MSIDEYIWSVLQQLPAVALIVAGIRRELVATANTNRAQTRAIIALAAVVARALRHDSDAPDAPESLELADSMRELNQAVH